MAQALTKGTSDNTTNIYDNLSASCNGFTSSFYKELVAAEKGNIVISPFSIHMTLSLLSHGAETTTLHELKTNLYHNDIELLKKETESLISALKETRNVKLYLANSIYIQDGFEVLTDFLSISSNIFQSEVSNLDFENNINAAEKINAWVKQATENKINDLVSSGDFDKHTKLVLTNAVYFRGNWLYQFDVKNTEKRMFHTTKTAQKLVPTMFTKASFNCGELPELNAKFIEVPYSSEAIAMIIILPNEVDGLSALQNNFKWEILANAPWQNFEKVELYLPKFKFETAINLKDTLRKMGLNSMFEDTANFSRMSDKPLKVSKVVHKAIIEVNEEGTEAAAATAAVMRLRRMASIPKQFEVNHPFMFIIEHKLSKLPLFLGNVWDIEAVRERDEL